MWSCQPWKWPWKRTSTLRPLKARASRTAISVASVPEAVKRIRSADGTRRWMARAQASSRGWLAPKCVPACSAALTAATILGWLWPRISEPWPPKKSM